MTPSCTAKPFCHHLIRTERSRGTETKREGRKRGNVMKREEVGVRKTEGGREGGREGIGCQVCVFFFLFFSLFFAQVEYTWKRIQLLKLSTTEMDLQLVFD